MNLHLIESGRFKLDGGAMFGVVPKSIWNKTNPADENNLIDIAARCLLIESGDRLILVDTGMGHKQSDKFFGYYHLWGDDSLEKSIRAKGFHPDDITDVFLTHLHFDHVGGATKWNRDKTAVELAFKNATYWSNAKHWDWATDPNPREKASFLKENLLPIQDSGNLAFLDLTQDLIQSTPLGFEMIVVDGHTEKQMLPLISYKGHKILYAADLIPTAGHIPLPYVMGYDVRPLQTMIEKKEILNRAVAQNYLLLFEHDAHNELASLELTERGVRLTETIKFNTL